MPFRLTDTLQIPLMERMCRTGRCMLRLQENVEPEQLNWDPAGPWELWVAVRRTNRIVTCSPANSAGAKSGWR